MAKVCPKCGRTLEQFYKTSMLGCENCYKAFSAELLPVLKKMHGKTEHLGKRPRVSGVERELIYEYKRLLAENERTIEKIAEECGYTGAKYFREQFKRLTGLSPQAYRAKMTADA